MRRAFFAVLIVVAGAMALVGLSSLRSARELIPWQTDFKAAQLESHRTGKPVFVDFTADWCGPCQEMRRATWSDANVAAALRDYIPVQINVDANATVASQFNVRGIPHLVVLSSRGDIVQSADGGMDPVYFLHWLGSKPPH